MSSENLGRGELIEPFLLLGDGMNERSTMVGLAGDFHGSGLGAAHDFLVADRQHGDIGRYHFIRVAIIAAQGSLATPAVGLVGLQDFPIAAVADRARGYEIVLKQIAQMLRQLGTRLLPRDLVEIEIMGGRLVLRLD